MSFATAAAWLPAAQAASCPCVASPLLPACLVGLRKLPRQQFLSCAVRSTDVCGGYFRLRVTSARPSHRGNCFPPGNFFVHVRPLGLCHTKLGGERSKLPEQVIGLNHAGWTGIRLIPSRLSGMCNRWLCAHGRRRLAPVCAVYWVAWVITRKVASVCGVGGHGVVSLFYSLHSRSCSLRLL